MANEYYNPSNAPATGSTLSSATIRAEFAAIGVAMDKMPVMAGNGDEVVTVNPGASGLTSKTSGVVVGEATTSATSKATPVDADTLPINDSAASGILKKLTWANLKATLATWIGSGSIAGGFTSLTASGNVTLGDASTDTVTVNGYMGVQATPVSTQALTLGRATGHNIYASGTAQNYFAGNVGIGNTAPGSQLQITGATDSYIRINSSGAADGTGIKFIGTGTDSKLYIGQRDAGNTASVSQVVVDTAGNLGVGTASPSSTLDVASAASDAVVSMTATGVQRWQLKTERSTGNFLVYDQTGSAQVLSLFKGKTLALQGATSQTGAGISFPATQVASSDANTLDDYEEGTFTPTIVGTTTAGTGTYSVQVGRYTKIGNKVYFDVAITWSAHTGTGNMRIGSLPFTSANTTNGFGFSSVGASNLTYSDQLTAYVESNSAQCSFATFATGAVLTPLAIDTAATVYVAGFYTV